MLKIEKIEEKETVGVLGQAFWDKDCSTKRDPDGFFKGCREDCTDPDKYAWYGSPNY